MSGRGTEEEPYELDNINPPSRPRRWLKWLWERPWYLALIIPASGLLLSCCVLVPFQLTRSLTDGGLFSLGEDTGPVTAKTSAFELWETPNDPKFHAGRIEVEGILTGPADGNRIGFVVPPPSQGGFAPVGSGYYRMQAEMSRGQAGIGPTGVVAEVKSSDRSKLGTLKRGDSITVVGRNPKRVDDPRNPVGYYVVLESCTLK